MVKNFGYANKEFCIYALSFEYGIHIRAFTT